MPLIKIQNIPDINNKLFYLIKLYLIELITIKYFYLYLIKKSTPNCYRIHI